MSQIYALLSVKFPGLKICECKKNDKYQVCSTHLHLGPSTLGLGAWSLQRKGGHSLSTAATFSFSYLTRLHLAYTPQSLLRLAPSSALLHHSAALSNSSSTGASQRQVQGSYSTPNPVRHVCLYRHTYIGITYRYYLY